MDIKLSKAAVKFIEAADRHTKERMRKGILGLTEQPPQGDIKTMQGCDGIYRLRVGKYRIVYEYTDKGLYVRDIDSRGDIYK